MSRIHRIAVFAILPIALLGAAAGRAAEPPAASARQELAQAFAGGLPVRPVSPVFVDLHPLAARLMRLQIPLPPDASRAERVTRRAEIARAATELGVTVPASVVDCYVDNACGRLTRGDRATDRRGAPAKGPLTRAQLNAILQSAVRTSDGLRDDRRDGTTAQPDAVQLAAFWDPNLPTPSVGPRIAKGPTLHEPPSPELHRRLLAERLEPNNRDLPLANVPATYLHEVFLQTRREYERLHGQPMPQDVADSVFRQVHELAYGRQGSPVEERILKAQQKQMDELRDEVREMIIPGYACYTTVDSWSERGAVHKGTGGAACLLSVFPLASKLVRTTGSAATSITAAAARDVAAVEVRNAERAIQNLQASHWAVLETHGLELDLPALTSAFEKTSFQQPLSGRVPIDLPGFAPYAGVNKVELSGKNLEQVKQWAEAVLATAQKAFPNEKLRITRIDLGRGWNANQNLVHADQTGTYLHGIVTVRGESTIVFLPGANAPSGKSVLAGRGGEHLFVKHFPLDGGPTVAIPPHQYLQPSAGQTVLITGGDRRLAVPGASNTNHSSPLRGAVPEDRITLFIDIKPEP